MQPKVLTTFATERAVELGNATESLDDFRYEESGDVLKLLKLT